MWRIREIDQQAVVADGVPGCGVAAALDGNEDAVPAGEADRVLQVGSVQRLRDEPGTAIDHRVEHPARLVVPGTGWREGCTPQPSDELGERGVGNGTPREIEQ